MTKRPVKSDLPAEVAVEDFSTLQVTSQAELDQAYKRASNDRFAKASHQIIVQ